MFFSLLFDLFVTTAGLAPLSFALLPENATLHRYRATVLNFLYAYKSSWLLTLPEKQNPAFSYRVCALSDHGRIQTCNLLSRNQMRYSVAPRGLIFKFLHFLPAADFKYFSLFLASVLILKNSLCAIFQGKNALVD